MKKNPMKRKEIKETIMRKQEIAKKKWSKKQKNKKIEEWIKRIRKLEKNKKSRRNNERTKIEK